MSTKAKPKGSGNTHIDEDSEEFTEQMLAQEAEMDIAAISAASAAAQPQVVVESTLANTEEKIRVWVVRHSERADEQGKKMQKQMQRSAEQKCGHRIHRADSLLTTRGIHLARVAGKLLNSKLNGRPVTVFTSPLLRCAQTAALLRQEITDETENIIYPVSGLGSCALAINRKGLKASIAQVYQSSESICAVCDRAVRVAARDDTIDTSFVACMDRVATQMVGRRFQPASDDDRSTGISISTSSTRDVICVTHREAFYGEFFLRSGAILPYKPPYNCIAEFLTDGSRWDLQRFDVGYNTPLSQAAKKRNPTKRRCRVKVHIEDRIGDKDVEDAMAKVFPATPSGLLES